MKNWKTTLVGTIAGALMVGLELIMHGETNYKTVGLAVALALLGAVSKDHDKTGTK